MNKTNTKYILGADIGGSHITAAVVDVDRRMLLKNTYVREHLNTNGTAKEIIQSWASVIKKSIGCTEQQIVDIGLAIPGPFDYETGISQIKNQGKYEQLFGVNVKQMLANELSISTATLFFDNDAACFLKGEIFAGNANKDQNILGLTLGTGLGSVIAKDGAVRDGELWCSPYKGSIAEDYISTRWFLKRYEELTASTIKDVKQLVELGEAHVVAQIFKEFGYNLGQFIEKQIKVNQIDLVIIGGNIAKASAHFMPYLQHLPIPVEITTLGENSALIGAASGLL